MTITFAPHETKFFCIHIMLTCCCLIVSRYTSFNWYFGAHNTYSELATKERQEAVMQAMLVINAGNDMTIVLHL
jgi:hypothetical protein